MGQDNRRRATRAACEVPVRIETRLGGGLACELVDVSRTGLRLRLPGEALGVHRLSSLVQVARRAADVLGEHFHAEIHYERLGPLLRKGMRSVRIAKRDWERADVEVGCLLDEPLGDLELGLLEVSLPPLQAAPPPAPVIPSSGPLPRPRANGYDAYVLSGDDARHPPMRARTETLTRAMAILRVTDLGEDLRDLDVTSLVIALDRRYGASLTLRVVDGEDDLWMGPAELKEVDVDPLKPGVIRIGVAFGRELRAEELNRLGLPSPA